MVFITAMVYELSSGGRSEAAPMRGGVAMSMDAINWDVWGAPSLLALAGFFVFCLGLARLFRFKLVTGGGGALLGGALMALGAAGGLFGLNLHTYNRLSFEQPVAEIALRQQGPQAFVATLRLPDGAVQDYDLSGDQWRLEARVLKFKPWANVLGFDAMYRLDRLSGRYAKVEQETTTLPTAHALASDPGLDVFTMAQRYGDIAPVVDATYGSGAFLPMADGAAFEITLSQSGLVARPLNEAAAEAAKGAW